MSDLEMGQYNPFSLRTHTQVPVRITKDISLYHLIYPHWPTPILTLLSKKYDKSRRKMVQTRFQAQFQGVKSFDLPMDKHDNTNSPALKSENFDDTLSCSEFASTTSFYSEGTPLREGSLETTIKVESLVEQLDEYVPAYFSSHFKQVYRH
jgi:hypothetical protein